jgi:hypothetical protein
VSIARSPRRWVVLSRINAGVVMVLACGGPTTLQVIYDGGVPADGLTVTVTQNGQQTVIRGSSFSVEGFGTPHSIPQDLRHTGPTEALIHLSSPSGTVVVEGQFTFDVVGGTVYQMTLVYTSTRPVCAHGCAPKMTFPSLLQGSSDTLFVYLASPPPPGVISHHGGASSPWGVSIVRKG